MIDRRALLATTTAALVTSQASAATMNTAPKHNPEIAKTQYGPVKGASVDGVTTFKGIPYGAPTAGGARFRLPSPPPPWREPRDATAFGPMCPQLTSPLPSIFASWTFDKDMSEDCLKLNVWIRPA